MRPLALLSLLLTCAAPAAPLLHSNPGAAVKLYLDFDGEPAANWDGRDIPATPAYGRPAATLQVWARVAEKFSPFNIDVTTEDPGTYGHGQAVRVVIGGSSWTAAGGVVGTSHQGSFDNLFLSGTSYVFSAALGEDPAAVAEAAAHESGHDFGLAHQTDAGDTLGGPLMRGSLGTYQRGLWWKGPNEYGPTVIQDDMALIAAAIGYRAQDHGQTIATADTLTGTATGIVGSTADRDTFAFDAAGLTTVRLDVAANGPTLHGKLELLDAAGATLAIAGAATLGQSLTADLAPGRYYAVAESHGAYGDVGQYTVSVATPEPGGILALAALPAMALRRVNRRLPPRPNPVDREAQRYHHRHDRK